MTNSEEANGINLIIEVTAASFEITTKDLISRKRDAKTATARQVAMYLCCMQQRWSLARIGGVMGGRTSATVSHAFQLVSGRLESSLKFNRLLRRKVHEIKDLITKKQWYEYKPFTLNELEELIGASEALRHPGHKMPVEYMIVCLELEIALRKLYQLTPRKE